MPVGRYVVHIEYEGGFVGELNLQTLSEALGCMAAGVGEIEAGTSEIEFISILDRAFDNRLVVSFSDYDLGYEVED